MKIPYYRHVISSSTQKFKKKCKLRKQNAQKKKKRERKEARERGESKGGDLPEPKNFTELSISPIRSGSLSLQKLGLYTYFLISLRRFDFYVLNSKLKPTVDRILIARHCSIPWSGYLCGFVGFCFVCFVGFSFVRGLRGRWWELCIHMFETVWVLEIKWLQLKYCPTREN